MADFFSSSKMHKFFFMEWDVKFMLILLFRNTKPKVFAFYYKSYRKGKKYRHVEIDGF